MESWGQISNLDNGGEITKKGKKDRGLGKIIAKIQRVIFEVLGKGTQVPGQLMKTCTLL